MEPSPPRLVRPLPWEDRHSRSRLATSTAVDVSASLPQQEPTLSCWYSNHNSWVGSGRSALLINLNAGAACGSAPVPRVLLVKTAHRPRRSPRDLAPYDRFSSLKSPLLPAERDSSRLAPPSSCQRTVNFSLTQLMRPRKQGKNEGA